MKKLLITVLALGAGLTACSDKKDDADGGEKKTSQSADDPKAALASYKISGMT